jgi:CPA1 family monovalent cation:H+ antiporter
MLEIGLFVLILTALSIFLQEKTKIPYSITVIFVALLLNIFDYYPIKIDNNTFDHILLLLLPMLIAIDALHLKYEDVKEHAFSLLYVAGVSVVLSVFAGVLLNQFIFPEYDLSIAALVMLFCMVSATDPVSVSAVFSNYKVPKKLKVLCEGESLFNDCTALIIFSIALLSFKNEVDVTGSFVAIHVVKMIVISSLVGFILGYLGSILVRLTDSFVVETSIILGVAFASFYIVETMHLSGILSVVVAMLAFTKHISDFKNNLSLELSTLKDHSKRGFLDEIGVRNQRVKEVETYIDDFNLKQKLTFNTIQFCSIVGVIVLFLSMGSIVEFESLIKYWKEILAIFIVSTVIRFIMMSKFKVISNKASKMHNISDHWYKVLVFAGVKGALSILMVHLIPDNFEHKVMFEAIVIGVILLTSVLYPLGLTIVFKIDKEKFKKDF